ncbi:MAG: xanthomonadin biosynthesis protein [Rhodanobacter sp.]
MNRPPTSLPTRRAALLLLLSYPLLTLAGAWSGSEMLSLAALYVLLTAALLPHLWSRRVGAWLVWLVALTGLAWVSHYGYAGLIVELVPVLINAMLACWFGLTLGQDEPRVARFIIAIEGRQRLEQPGVADYARRLTWFWSLLLAAQAVVLMLLLLCAVPGGLLARAGLASPLPVPEGWAMAWIHVGGYVLLGAVLEYGYRRWRLRHLQHLDFRATTLALVRHWPQILRGDDGSKS